MSILKSITIENFRNLESVSLEFDPAINLFYGQNGGGKSSLLEAIYTLAYGKSYRNHLKARVIRYGQPCFRLFSHFLVGAQPMDYRAGIEKSQHDETLIKLNGDPITVTAEIARLLPVLLINPNSYEIIEDGPASRRKYLDWGVFHVKHEFHQAWKIYSRCLKQRNLSLKMRYSKSICQSWDAELIRHGEVITACRRDILNLTLPKFVAMLSKLGLNNDIKCGFYTGYSQDKTLAEAINDTFESDYSQGFTHSGPHRADLRLTVDGIPGDDILSRGQEKLIVSALQLAQAEVVSEETNNSVIYMFDDLPSELDLEKCEKLFELIHQVSGQLIITATESSLFTDKIKNNAKMFHVKQGKIIE